MTTIITINNDSYKLHYDFNALCEYELHSKQPITEIQSSLQTLSGIRLLLFCGLQCHHGDQFKKPSQIGELLNSQNLQYVLDQVSLDISKSFGDASQL